MQHRYSRKYYAVARGQEIGVYGSWSKCWEQVDGYSGAVFRKFYSRTDAQDFINSYNFYPNRTYDGVPIVYVDGACPDNGKQNAQAGYGVFWGDGHPDNESGPLPGRATNNRAEFFAAICAIEQALERGLEALVVRTDSELLVKSLTKYIFTWRCNNWTTYNGSPLRNKDFLKRLNKLMRQIDVQFEHVDAHCGDYGNDQADYFARQGARIRIKYHR